jgi:hypothetical protein
MYYPNDYPNQFFIPYKYIIMSIMWLFLIIEKIINLNEKTAVFGVFLTKFGCFYDLLPKSLPK